MEQSEWLLELLAEERHDLLQVLDMKHKALIAAFKHHLAEEVTEDPPPLSREQEHLLAAATRVVPPKSPAAQPGLAKDFSGGDSVKDEIGTVMTRGASPGEDANDITKRDLLISLFDLVDSDGNGVITLDELRAAMQKVGKKPAQARMIVAVMEAIYVGEMGLKDGGISKDGWMHILESKSHILVELCDMASKLQKLMLEDSKRKGSDRCILSMFSNFRFLWDLLCSICVLYVVILVPYWIAFEGAPVADVIPLNERTVIAKCIDIIFCVDILLNFRTSYQSGGEEVRDGCRIALNYLRSWFLIDVVSSVPSSFFEESVGESSSVKLFKFVRFFSMLKVFRSAKAVNIISTSSFGELCEDFLIENRLQGKMKLFNILIALFFCCHWLACLMASCGLRFLTEINPDDLGSDGAYIPSLYWALTTVSTVGYGDIVPRVDSERLVAMFAMCVGGTIFGLSTGTLTSVVLSQNRAEMEKSNKLELVNHWMHRHPFPIALKRRLRGYFKNLLNHESNITREELDIFADLSNDLRSEVARILVPDAVREVPIFTCVPNNIIGLIVSILQTVSFGANEVIVRSGECGVAMFVIMEGHCVKTTPTNPNEVNSTEVIVAQLFVGESFGEEIILGLADDHSYTVVAHEVSKLSLITETLFLQCMSAIPQHLENMREFYKQELQATAEDSASPFSPAHSDV